MTIETDRSISGLKGALRYVRAYRDGVVAGDAMQRGVYISPWYDTLVIAPPLIITETQVDAALEVLDKSLEIADKEAVDTGTPVSHSTDYRK